jgi:hypothetical protein
MSIAIMGVLISLTCLSFLLKKRWQQKLERTRLIMDALNRNELFNYLDRDLCLEEINPKLAIGDLTCFYNARSPYLRCAVNPLGPCENCEYYQAIHE